MVTELCDWILIAADIVDGWTVIENRQLSKLIRNLWKKKFHSQPIVFADFIKSP